MGVFGVVEELPVVLTDRTPPGRPVESLVEEVGDDAGVAVDDVADHKGEAGLVLQHLVPSQGGIYVDPLHCFNFVFAFTCLIKLSNFHFETFPRLGFVGFINLV